MVKIIPAEKWVIRDEGGHWFASIFFDNDVGDISIQSEWGNYAYAWGKSGRGTDKLTEFLVTCDDSYITNKFSYGLPKWLDVDKTIQKIKKELLEANLPEDIRENCEYEIEEHLAGIEDVKDFYWSLSCHCVTLVDEVYSGDLQSIDFHTDYQPRLREFMKQVWPRFIQAIKDNSPPPQSKKPKIHGAEVFNGA